MSESKDMKSVHITPVGVVGGSVGGSVGVVGICSFIINFIESLSPSTYAL